MSRRRPAPDSPLRKVGGGAGRPRPRPAPSSLGSGRLARRPPGRAPLGHKAEAKGRLVHLALSGAGWPSSRRPQASSGKDHSPTLTALKPWGGKVKVTVLGSPALRFLALERSPALALRCLLGPTSWVGGEGQRTLSRWLVPKAWTLLGCGRIWNLQGLHQAGRC